MATPRERLESIKNTFYPSEAVFVAHRSASSYAPGAIYISPKVVRNKGYTELGDPLQKQMFEHVNEWWNKDNMQYELSSYNVDDMFATMKRSICSAYYGASARCDATKRKTERFIRSIELDNVHLANMMLVMFQQITSYTFLSSKEDRAKFFEPLESLRRVYGKTDK